MSGRGERHGDRRGERRGGGERRERRELMDWRPFCLVSLGAHSLQGGKTSEEHVIVLKLLGLHHGMSLVLPIPGRVLLTFAPCSRPVEMDTVVEGACVRAV